VLVETLNPAQSINQASNNLLPGAQAYRLNYQDDTLAGINQLLLFGAAKSYTNAAVTVTFVCHQHQQRSADSWSAKSQRLLQTLVQRRKMVSFLVGHRNEARVCNQQHQITRSGAIFHRRNKLPAFR